MADMNEASWIDAKVEVVKNYLNKESDCLALGIEPTHRALIPLPLIMGRNNLRCAIGWPILADSSVTQVSIDRLRKENVAEEMRLHGEDGYHMRTLPRVEACDSSSFYVLNALGHLEPIYQGGTHRELSQENVR